MLQEKKLGEKEKLRVNRALSKEGNMIFWKADGIRLLSQASAGTARAMQNL